MKKYFRIISYSIVISFFFSFLNVLNANSLLIQSTTSTRDSGLYNFILPEFEKKFGIKVYVAAFGTGQAIKNVENCDGDILISHAATLEEKFVKNGYGISRHNLMFNDFILVGPQNDPAKIRNLSNIGKILSKIAKTESIFISRGDNSGTHISELRLWKMSKIKPLKYNGLWYLQSGQGMGATLNIAVAKNAYTYTDRATWLKFANKRSHMVLFENIKILRNQYGIVRLNPSHCPNINHKNAQIFFRWITSNDGQSLIKDFNINGEKVFFPNYRPTL